MDNELDDSTPQQRHLPPTSMSVQQALYSTHRIKLNVGGQSHETSWTTLARIPTSRLGRLRHCTSHEQLMKICDDYDLTAMEFFFDRHPGTFTVLLDFYRTGKLHVVEEACVLAYNDELMYWGLDELSIESCCQHKYNRRKENLFDEMRKEEECLEQQDEENFGNNCSPSLRRKIWNLMENPQTSIAAKAMAAVMILFILLAIVCVVLNTLPSLKVYRITDDGNPSRTDNDNNYTDNPILARLDFCCIAWFTLEFVVRLWASPSKLQFIRNILNIIDFVVILSFFIYTVLDMMLAMFGFHKLHIIQEVCCVFQIFKIMRILRVFKLARYSVGLQSLGGTLQKSYKELGMLMMFLAIGVLMFSSLVYFAEKNSQETHFASIPEAFWWAIVTMTAVGYGDMIPVTPFGKVVGSLCCVCGVLVIALPIPIIVNNFSESYRDQMRRQKITKRRADMALARGQQRYNTSTSQLVHGIELTAVASTDGVGKIPASGETVDSGNKTTH